MHQKFYNLRKNGNFYLDFEWNFEQWWGFIGRYNNFFEQRSFVPLFEGSNFFYFFWNCVNLIVPFSNWLLAIQVLFRKKCFPRWEIDIYLIGQRMCFRRLNIYFGGLFSLFKMFENDCWNVRLQFDRSEFVFHPKKVHHYRKLKNIGYEKACELWNVTKKGEKNIYKMGYRPRTGKISIETLQWNNSN